MQTDARKLATYLVIVATLAILLFPPFDYGVDFGGSATEYGFLLSGPPSLQGVLSATGEEGSIARSMYHYTIDVPRIALELVVAWSTYAAVVTTVLKKRVVKT